MLKRQSTVPLYASVLHNMHLYTGPHVYCTEVGSLSYSYSYPFRILISIPFDRQPELLVVTFEPVMLPNSKMCIDELSEMFHHPREN